MSFPVSGAPGDATPQGLGLSREPRTQVLWTGSRDSPPLPSPTSCLASPLLLTEPLQGPEPGPELLLGLYAVEWSSLLQEHYLLQNCEFLGSERAGGCRHQQSQGPGWGKGPVLGLCTYSSLLPLMLPRPSLSSEMSITSSSCWKLSLMPSTYPQSPTGGISHF